MSGRWVINETRIIPQNIDEFSSTQLLPIGTIVRARDTNGTNNQGEGEFVYLKGVAATVVGSLVNYDLNVPSTTIAPATTGIGPVAVAMSICVANLFGWYQIGGIAAVKAPNAMVVGAEVFMLAATPGSVDDAQVNGEQVVNAKVLSTTGSPSAGLALIEINRPFLQGQIV